MTKTTFKVTYLLRKNKPFNNGEVPVIVRITLNGERVAFNAKHNAKPELWDQKTNRAIGKSVFARSLNTYLDHVYIKLCDSMRDLEDRGIEVTAQNVKDNYLGLMEHKQVTLLSSYEEHNRKMESLIGKGYAYSTLEKHFTTIGHLKEFVKQKYRRGDLLIEKVDNLFITDFEYYLKSEKNIGNNTTTKYLRNLGKVIRIAINAGYITKDPFNNVRLHIEEVDRPFLDELELQRLVNKQFAVKRLEQIKDAFLFCCFTGIVEKMQKEENKGNRLIVRNECLLMSVSA